LDTPGWIEYYAPLDYLIVGSRKQNAFVSNVMYVFDQTTKALVTNIYASDGFNVHNGKIYCYNTYVSPNSTIDIYDIQNNFAFVKTITLK
jgi:hypothetical protein